MVTLGGFALLDSWSNKVDPATMVTLRCMTGIKLTGGDASDKLL
jgi:hypothetical protein